MSIRKKRVIWTMQEEMAFLNMMEERRAEFCSSKKKSDIYKEMKADFKHLGINITAEAIKHKLDHFTTKYRTVLARMQTNPDACKEWPLFEAARDIFETIYGGKNVTDPISDAIRESDFSLKITETSRSATNETNTNCREMENKVSKIQSLQDNKTKQITWTTDQELEFIRVWAQRQEDLVSDKKNLKACNEITAHFEKLGLYLTPKIIKNKMDNLTKEYIEEKKLMETSNFKTSKSILFDKMNDIVKHPYFENLDEQVKNTAQTSAPCSPFEILQIDISPQSPTIIDYRRKRHNWTNEEELALVNMWCKYRAEVDIFERKSHIHRKISKDFQRLGKPLTPKAIKHKIDFLTHKYETAKKSMERKQDVDIDWLLFEALRKMMECEKHNSNKFVDDNLGVVSQNDIEKLITCGKIIFSTQHLQFLYICQLCKEQIDSPELFLQHTLNEHIILNEHQKQIYEANTTKSENIRELIINQINQSLHNVDDDEYDKESAFTESKAQYTLETSDQEDNNAENQQQLEEMPLNFEALYFDEQSDENKSLNQDEQRTDMENVSKYIKIAGPVRVDLKHIHHNQQGYQCPHCNKTFQHKYKLTSHIRTMHLGIKRYACSICGTRFKEYSNMQIHVKRHLNIKPHLCSVCGKTFISTTELYIHTRTHTQEKPYKCTECTQSFTTSSRLAVHLRRHRNERPHGCEYCEKRFFTRVSWANHVRTHTKERPFECPMCAAKFSQKATLRQHERLHTNMKSYQCKNCDAAFKQYAGLFGHLKRCNSKINSRLRTVEKMKEH